MSARGRQEAEKSHVKHQRSAAQLAQTIYLLASLRC